MATLPAVGIMTTSTYVDDEFIETLYEMREAAADNILTSNVLSALMKAKGVMVPQTGGAKVSRTVKYGKAQNPEAISRGSILPMGVPELETEASWPFERYYAAAVQRNMLQDTVNAGPLKNKDYVTKRLNAAMDSMKDQYEAAWLRAHVTAETGSHPQGLCDLVPPPATRATGTWGGIARPSNYTSDEPDAGNTWWSPQYEVLTAPYELNLMSDIRSFHQTVTDQMEEPDLILCSQTIFNMYMDFGLEATQILYRQDMLNLGFKVLQWMGADITWVHAMAASAVLKDGTSSGYAALTHALLFLNTRRLEVVYNPLVYMTMTDWQRPPRELTKLAYILCQQTLIGDQPRRHGLLYAS